MKSAIAMLVFFTLGLFLTTLISLYLPVSIEWLIRILFVFSAIPGVYLAYQSAKPHWQIPARKTHSPRIHAKRVGLSFLLLLPLIYSALLDRLGFPFYGIFLWDYLWVVTALLIFLPIYIRWSDARLQEPEDGYAKLGRFILREDTWSWKEHKALLMVWTVKTLFIPIMYGGLMVSLTHLLTFEFTLNPSVLVLWLFTFGLSFDLIIATLGYICTSRLLSTEVRSTDDTWLGWLSCMICYPPLLGILHFIRQQVDDVTWDQWLMPDNPLYWAWAAIIVFSWMVYWLSTASFGVRFSNLTYRGLIAHGPYRFTKHPSYLSKNIYWWLHTVPFVGVSTTADLARNLIGLACVSLIYYVRAWTEERHLRKFAEYRAYCTMIDNDGFFARCKKRLRKISVRRST